MKLNCCTKNEVKIPVILEIFYVEESRNPKTTNVKLPKMIELVCSFYGFYPYAKKNSIIAQFSHDITQIHHWELFLKCQGVPGHTQVNGPYKKDVLTDFPTKRKKLTSDISSFLRQSWITVLKHFRRKWPHLPEIIH